MRILGVKSMVEWVWLCALMGLATRFTRFMIFARFMRPMRFMRFTRLRAFHGLTEPMEQSTGFVKLVGVVLLSLLPLSCGPRAFVKGDYDDVSKANLLTDRWSETDMQNVVQALTKSLVQHPVIGKTKRPPVLLITRLQNKTSEHIDTQSIMDMLRVHLMKTGKVTFIDKAAREDISEEYAYQSSGLVSKGTRKGPGGQIGADFLINGRLDSITQSVGSKKTVFYKVTLNLTNLKTSAIVWSDHKQMRKAFRKRSVGW